MKWRKGRTGGGLYLSGWRGWELDICRWDGGWELSIAMGHVILWQNRYDTLRRAKEAAPVFLSTMLWREWRLSTASLA